MTAKPETVTDRLRSLERQVAMLQFAVVVTQLTMLAHWFLR